MLQIGALLAVCFLPLRFDSTSMSIQTKTSSLFGVLFYFWRCAFPKVAGQNTYVYVPLKWSSDHGQGILLRGRCHILQAPTTSLGRPQPLGVHLVLQKGRLSLQDSLVEDKLVVAGRRGRPPKSQDSRAAAWLQRLSPPGPDGEHVVSALMSVPKLKAWRSKHRKF